MRFNAQRLRSHLRLAERVGVGLMALAIIHVVPSFLCTPNKAKESSAKSVLGQMMEEQQAFFATHDAFLDESRMPTTQLISDEVPEYRFFTQNLGDRVYSYAEPIQDYPYGKYFLFPWNRFVGLKRYVGLVTVSSDSKRTQAGLCAVPSFNVKLELVNAYGELSCHVIGDY